MASRKEAAMETRRRILETGERLISEGGSHRVSVDDIVRECGIARGTFYLYFRNRADLVQAIARQPFADLESELEGFEGTVLEKLDYYAREFTRRAQRFGPKVAQQWMKDTMDPEEAPDTADPHLLPYDVESLRKILARSVESGELAEDTPVDRIAMLVVSQMFGVLTCWCMYDGDLDTDSLLDDYRDMSLRGMVEPYIARS